MSAQQKTIKNHCWALTALSIQTWPIKTDSRHDQQNHRGWKSIPRTWISTSNQLTLKWSLKLGQKFEPNPQAWLTLRHILRIVVYERQFIIKGKQQQTFKHNMNERKSCKLPNNSNRKRQKKNPICGSTMHSTNSFLLWRNIFPFELSLFGPSECC